MQSWIFATNNVPSKYEVVSYVAAQNQNYIQPLFYIPFLNSSSHIFGLTPLGWLHSIILKTPSYLIISYGNIIFYLCTLFQEHNKRIK
jgi:hypothetical protein